MPTRAIREYLDSRRPRHLEELKELLRFPSISAQQDHHADCVACADWLARECRAMGLDAVLNSSTAKPIVLAQGPQQPGKPTLLVYGHYDVQPPDPLELWHSPPFEPTQRGDDLYARGASDDKGQIFAWMKAAEAWQGAGGGLPVNLKFFFEGEEEIGSPHMEAFVAGNRALLRCDYLAVSDTEFLTPGIPSLCYGVRGLTYVEITLTGANRDLHSGSYGGAAPNPINALARLVAGMHDDKGRVTVPGFYDDVVPLSETEREMWRQLGVREELKADLGVDALPGEDGYTALERRWGRPTLDCNGIWGGYTGQGAKTVIPAYAKAKLSTRLVCDQDPQKVLAGLRQYLQEHRPPGTKVEMEVLSQDEPWLTSPDSPALRLAAEAMGEAFGAPCKLTRAGGSIPMTRLFQKHLGVDALMMGFGLPDDRIHSPNEKLTLENFYGGIRAGAIFMGRIASK